MAQELGLSVAWTFKVKYMDDPDHTSADLGKHFTNDDYMAWFEYYRLLVHDYALHAQACNVTELVIGHELVYMCKFLENSLC